MLGVGENADREILGIDPRMRTATDWHRHMQPHPDTQHSIDGRGGLYTLVIENWCCYREKKT